MLHNVLGLIKSSVRRRRADQGEADCWAQAAAEGEGSFCRSLDLILHVEVNGKEQALSSQFLSSLCVSRINTHTHTHTSVQMCSQAPSRPCKCRSGTSPSSFLPLFLSLSLSLSLSDDYSVLWKRRSLSILHLGPLNVLDVMRCDSLCVSSSCGWLVGGDLGKKQQRIPLHPRQPGKELAAWNNPTQLSIMEKPATTRLSVMQRSAKKCNTLGRVVEPVDT